MHFAGDKVTQSKNESLSGWFVASYLLRFVELSEMGNDDPEKRFATWENTILVKANDINEAFDKAEHFAKKETLPYKGGPQAIDVQWVYEGITDLLPIYEDIADGAEIMWAKHAPRKLRNIRKHTKTKIECIN